MLPKTHRIGMQTVRYLVRLRHEANGLHKTKGKKMTTAIKYETVIPGMVVARELKITIIKLYGNWDVQTDNNHKRVGSFGTLREAKAFVAETLCA
jgi:hypothetical protein